MIPQSDLSRLSNRLAEQGGRRIPETVLERDYCLSWFLVGLASSTLRHRLAFKGGTALKKCYFGDYRFSEDLDFSLIKETSWEEIERHLAIVFEETREASGVEVLDRARNEPRDLYDLWFLTANGHVRLRDLRDPVERKLEFRGLTLA